MRRTTTIALAALALVGCGGNDYKPTADDRGRWGAVRATFDPYQRGAWLALAGALPDDPTFDKHRKAFAESDPCLDTSDVGLCLDLTGGPDLVEDADKRISP